MTKIRTIKPGFWEDEDLAKLPYGCRLFFVGMWCNADDFGVCKASPVLLKSKIFPYDTTRIEEVNKWLDALVDARKLIPIQFKSESYYVIRTFRSHQKIDKRWGTPLIPEDVVNDAIKSAWRDNTEATPRPPRGHGDGSGSVIGSVIDNPLPTDVGSPPTPKTKYENFVEWIQKNAPKVLQLPEPITEEQYKQLMSEFGRDKVCEILLAMHNYKYLLKKNNSAYLTARAWIRRDEKNNPEYGKSIPNNRGNANEQKYGSTAAAKHGILAGFAQLDGDGVKE